MEVKEKHKNLKVSDKLLVISTVLGLASYWNTVQDFGLASDLVIYGADLFFVW